MSDILNDKLELAAREVREYGMSENAKTWLRLFDALVEVIKVDLMHADVDAVPALQAQARQLRALQDIATSKTPTNGRA